MIPKDFVSEWRAQAPWALDLQVEQDLIISRTVVEIFNDATLAEDLAFRGGTALYKLFFVPAARYSEDIDLVQVRPQPIGSTLDRLRKPLDSWLGRPHRAVKPGRIQLVYRVKSEGIPPLPLRLKIEINSAEHFSVFGHVRRPFEVRSRWYSGRADVNTYSPEELLGTKLRALYQRKKGRDLFDLWKALGNPSTNNQRIVEAFSAYMDHEGRRVSRAEFERNLDAKLRLRNFQDEVAPLLPVGESWDFAAAADLVQRKLVSLLPGEPWKGAQENV